MEGLFLKNITAGYGANDVLIDLQLEVPARTTLVLLGVSGSGKTTLLKTITGIIKPKKGDIILAGKNITELPIEERNISYLPQNYGLFPHLTVAGNIAYGLRVRGMSVEMQTKTVAELLELWNFPATKKDRLLELSGGQQQRVALARALAVKPKLMLLDEPLSSIDQATKFDVATHLKKMFSALKIPIILVTHQYEDAQFFGTHVAVMVQGVIEQTGSYN